MLAAAPRVHYVHEPFSVTDAPSPGICSQRFGLWFTHLTPENEGEAQRRLRKTVDLRYDWLAATRALRSPKDLVRTAREARGLREARRERSRVLLKAPIAVLSAEWLADRIGTEIVVVIRHPAAFISSLKKLGWSHPFGDFVAQPLLMNGMLSPFDAEIRAFASSERPVVEQGILLWRIIHHAIRTYRERHPDWIFVRHEDLSRDPTTEFQSLFSRLGLEFTPQVEATIREFTGGHNVAVPDAAVGTDETLRRDSRRNLRQWRKRLTDEEFDSIRAGVADVSASFYSDQDW